jgi:hypothetical protein
MKKMIKHGICLFGALIIFTACEKWLDVAPSSQVREEEQFQSEVGFQQALLGCYLGMAQDSLYGRDLSWYLPGMLSQTYNKLSMSSGGTGYFFQRYMYTSAYISRMVVVIWEQSYNVIANANNALKFIDKNKSILNVINHDLIKGELLAIRAYMHFDLLRLYGYGDLAHRADKSTRLTIPYVTEMTKEMTGQSTYSEVLLHIINDLKEAITLLALDPITGEHPAEFYDAVNQEGFYNRRAMRLNYYAAKALLARVYMWEGSAANLEQAKSLAMELIEMNEERNLFPWVITNFDQQTGLYPEQLFGLNVAQLLTNAGAYFLLEFLSTDYAALYITDANLRQMYEVDAGIGGVDVRYGKGYYFNSNSYCIPLKIRQQLASSMLAQVSMIRLPELYYMAAECHGAGATPDYAKAKQLIRQVRETRGIIADFTCNDNPSLYEALQKEYQKEFVAEGVLFYFYKRIGKTEIIDSGGDVIEMNDATYTFPYPDLEIQSGRVQ